jgi:hypothetical protein
MRGQYQNKLPNKLYFINDGYRILGPYIKKPSTIMKRLLNPRGLIIYVKDEFDNYIKQPN